MECFVYSKRIFLQNDRLFKKGEKKGMPQVWRHSFLGCSFNVDIKWHIHLI